MSDNSETDFIEMIMKNLTSNGFPEKRVSLPLEKMYEIADNKGLNLNTVLKSLESEGIVTDNTVDKIIFSKKQVVTPTSNPLEGFDMGSLKDMDPAEMMAKYNEMMAKMSPEQMNEIKSMYENMSPEEKDEIMKKGKEMGIS